MAKKKRIGMKQNELGLLGSVLTPLSESYAMGRGVPAQMLPSQIQRQEQQQAKANRQRLKLLEKEINLRNKGAMDLAKQQAELDKTKKGEKEQESLALMDQVFPSATLPPAAPQAPVEPEVPSQAPSLFGDDDGYAPGSTAGTEYPVPKADPPDFSVPEQQDAFLSGAKSQLRELRRNPNLTSEGKKQIVQREQAIASIEQAEPEQKAEAIQQYNRYAEENPIEDEIQIPPTIDQEIQSGQSIKVTDDAIYTKTKDGTYQVNVKPMQIRAQQESTALGSMLKANSDQMALDQKASQADAATAQVNRNAAIEAYGGIGRIERDARTNVANKMRMYGISSVGPAMAQKVEAAVAAEKERLIQEAIDTYSPSSQSSSARNILSPSEVGAIRDQIATEDYFMDLTPSQQMQAIHNFGMSYYGKGLASLMGGGAAGGIASVPMGGASESFGAITPQSTPAQAMAAYSGRDTPMQTEYALAAAQRLAFDSGKPDEPYDFNAVVQETDAAVRQFELSEGVAEDLAFIKKYAPSVSVRDIVDPFLYKKLKDGGIANPVATLVDGYRQAIAGRKSGNHWATLAGGPEIKTELLESGLFLTSPLGELSTEDKAKLAEAVPGATKIVLPDGRVINATKTIVEFARKSTGQDVSADSIWGGVKEAYQEYIGDPLKQFADEAVGDYYGEKVNTKAVKKPGESQEAFEKRLKDLTPKRGFNRLIDMITPDPSNAVSRPLMGGTGAGPYVTASGATSDTRSIGKRESDSKYPKNEKESLAGNLFTSPLETVGEFMENYKAELEGTEATRKNKTNLKKLGRIEPYLETSDIRQQMESYTDLLRKAGTGARSESVAKDIASSKQRLMDTLNRGINETSSNIHAANYSRASSLDPSLLERLKQEKAGLEKIREKVENDELYVGGTPSFNFADRMDEAVRNVEGIRDVASMQTGRDIVELERIVAKQRKALSKRENKKMRESLNANLRKIQELRGEISKELGRPGTVEQFFRDTF